MIDGQDTQLRSGLPPRRNGPAPDADLLARRASIAELSGAGPVAYVDIAGLRCAVADVAAPRATIVHCHGGGYRHGTAQGWAAYATRMASATGARILVPEYALAPEQPFPNALHEIVAVIAALADATDAPLILTGDSAGGGLALAAASVFARPLPVAGIALLSPWLDLRLGAASYDRCAATDAMFSHAAASVSAAAYLQGIASDDPLASPLLGDLAGLPPVQLQVGAGEVLVDDSLALAARLVDAGVRVDLHVEPDVPHVWPVIMPDLPAARRALLRLARFIDDIVDQQENPVTAKAPA